MGTSILVYSYCNTYYSLYKMFNRFATCYEFFSNCHEVFVNAGKACLRCIQQNPESTYHAFKVNDFDENSTVTCTNKFGASDE